MIEKDETAAELSRRAGIAPAHFSRALRPGPSFTMRRYRMRIERAIGQRFWTNPQEAAELAEISQRLGVDIVSESIRGICKALVKAGLREVIPGGGIPCGKHLFRALIQHFSPNSTTLKSAHYL